MLPALPLNTTVNTAILPLCLCSEDWDDTSDRITKLAYQDVRHAQALKEALREHHYAQFTFAPEINPRSRQMGKVRFFAQSVCFKMSVFLCE